MKTKTNEPTTPWRNREGAATYLSCCAKTIDRYRREGRLVPKYVGNRPVFHTRDLDKIPTPQPQPPAV